MKKNTKILPPTYLLIAILAMLILHFALPLFRMVPMPWNLAGLVPLLIGTVINLFADKALHTAHTTVKPFVESTSLVVNSVYSFSRHPMYLGFVLILMGIATLLGSLTPWVIIPIFVVLMEVVFIQVEERMLGEKFGSAWLVYKKEVRRWI
jgi:protein-S-isoprenylcysteine O-methyltransferase Ste14